MSDYIKRENAKRAVWGCARDTGIDEAPFEYAEGLLEDVPSEDVAPVRHAKWISKAMRIMCSDCGAEFNDEIVYMLNNYEPMNYCPNCGARMDGESDDE